jgi:hypothetical protein
MDGGTRWCTEYGTARSSCAQYAEFESGSIFRNEELGTRKCFSLLQSSDQSAEHSAHFVSEAPSTKRVSVCHELQSYGELEVSLNLRERAAGDREIAQVVTDPLTRVPFGDVRGDGRATASYLVTQTS